jgi:hypothetical protein
MPERGEAAGVDRACTHAMPGNMRFDGSHRVLEVKDTFLSRPRIVCAGNGWVSTGHNTRPMGVARTLSGGGGHHRPHFWPMPHAIRMDS